mgnify:CR=1 FL=1
MTEKIIKILESYESLDENGNEYIKPKDYNSLASKLLEAINYTRCCEELKREKCNMCNEEKDCQGHAVCEDCGGRSF